MTAHVHEKQLFSAVDVVSLIKEKRSQGDFRTLLTGTEDQVRELVPPMCKLDGNYQFQSNAKLKLIVISNTDSTNGMGIVQNMNYAASDITSSYVQLPSLVNTVVVYQEHRFLGNNDAFNPLIHLVYQPYVLDSMRQQTDAQFKKNLKLAYIDYDNAVDTDNIKIK